MRLSSLACLGPLLLIALTACGDVPQAGTTSEARTVSPSGLSAGSLSPAAFVIDTTGHVDFYRWDGTFIRRLDSSGPILPSSDGRYYVTNRTGQIWTAEGLLSGKIAEWSFASFGWAKDGNYLCGSGKNPAGGYTMYLTDLQGRSREYILGTSGDIHNVFGCSTNTSRAVVLEGSGQLMTVISLSDGHVETTVPLPKLFASSLVSPDANWLVENIITTPGGAHESDLVDLGDGSVHYRLANGTVVAFSPDSQYLVANDDGGTSTRMVDWRTSHDVWSSPGYVARAAAVSDPATNEMLLEVATGSAAAGTQRSQYWIVTGHGVATQFIPQN